jgi:hypothetical protein
VDEDMNYIQKKTYKKKCKLNIYVCKRHKTDTIIINKVYDKYKFGRVSNDHLQEIKIFLFENTETKVNSMKNIIVKYNDSLFGFREIEEKRKKHYDKVSEKYKNSLTNSKKKFKIAKYVPLTFKSYTKNHIDFIKTQQKCIKKVNEVFNSEAFYVYHFDQGHNTLWSDLNWIQDKTGVFKKYFFKIPDYDGMLILRPDGEFFVTNTHLSEKTLTKLLNGDWSTLKKDWLKTKKEFIKKGYGFFEAENNFKRQTCF